MGPNPNETPDMRRPGHPRHQVRPFTVTARHISGHVERIPVDAQTEHDAILRAGHILGADQPETEPDSWTVTGVRDPAPATWTPDTATAHAANSALRAALRQKRTP